MKSYFKYYVIGMFVLTAIISCSTTKNKFTQADILKLDSLVTQKQFTIESDMASTQITSAMQQVYNVRLMPAGSGVGNVNLIGNYNFLTISGDSISSHLPYFGEVRSSANYGSNNGAITFKGTTKNYTVIKNKDASYNILFDAKSNTESFEVNIKLFPNLHSSIFLNGFTRSSIRYDGTVRSSKKTETQKHTTP